MQAGHVTPGSTTASVFGPVAGASHVVLRSSGNNNVYIGASSGLSASSDRSSLYVIPNNEVPVSFRMGEGETLYASADSGGELDYLAFPI